jgi:hypothetical protein
MKFAQILNGAVHWIFEADEPPQFAPTIQIIDITLLPSVEVGDLYQNDQTFIKPDRTPELMAAIRMQRDALLQQCDWTQVGDSPLSPEQKIAWQVYRHALRDFPAHADVNNPQWPISPGV